MAAREEISDLDFRMIELLFFAYRDFVGDADTALEQYGFGRAHHRVLHFVMRQPDIAVADLLHILAITKQSLNPILRQLTETGHLQMTSDPRDRRRRLLRLTGSGRNLALRLTQMQSGRIERALEESGADAGERRTIEDFLFAMIEPDERGFVS